MKFTRPDDLYSLREIAGTVIIPREDGEYPAELFNTLHQQLDARSGTFSRARPLLREEDGYLELDPEMLAILCWEHQQYSAARGFSTSTMEVLWVIQELAKNTNRIRPKDIRDFDERRSDQRLADYSQQTINHALSRLVEFGLVTKEDTGLYNYAGFDEWSPNRDGPLTE